MDSTATLSEPIIFQLSLWTLALGALIIILVIMFGIFLIGFRKWWRSENIILDELLHILHTQNASGARTTKLLLFSGAMYTEYLNRRNEFWRSYGQITIAILLLIAVTILLLTKTINPDAGLPILSGITGFAIAKGSDSNRGMPQLPREENE